MARKTVKYLVRSQLSGVVIGELDTQGGQTVTLKNAQHIHTWQGGALSAFDLAASGPKDCKLSQKVDQVTIFDVFQIVKMSDVAITKFDGIKPWVAR